jgi:hypothetical protein
MNLEELTLCPVGVVRVAHHGIPRTYRLLKKDAVTDPDRHDFIVQSDCDYDECYFVTENGTWQWIPSSLGATEPPKPGAICISRHHKTGSGLDDWWWVPVEELK